MARTIFVILNSIRSPNRNEVLNLQTYVSLMHIMAVIKAYRTMLDVCYLSRYPCLI